jgi:hypothetical protein
MNSASLCCLAGRYDNPFPTRCLAPIDYLKIPAQYLKQDSMHQIPEMEFTRATFDFWQLAIYSRGFFSHLGFATAEDGGGRIVYLSTSLYLRYAFNVVFFLKFINEYFIECYETDSK